MSKSQLPRIWATDLNSSPCCHPNRFQGTIISGPAGHIFEPEPWGVVPSCWSQRGARAAFFVVNSFDRRSEACLHCFGDRWSGQFASGGSCIWESRCDEGCEWEAKGPKSHSNKSPQKFPKQRFSETWRLTVVMGS